jgi:hypothetical protein
LTDTGNNIVTEDCWCCGNPYPSADLIHLGAHPETVVCLQCSTYLGRRAKAAYDARNPSFGGHLRGVVGAGRDLVIRLRLHERPILGRLLRRMDRRLP